MAVARPRSLAAALDALAEDPDADVLGGGTDYMVEVNAGLRRPTGIVSLRRVDELSGVARDGDALRLGAGLTWAGMEAELADDLPALAAAGRSVGSRQIRNAGTLGGNVAGAAPKASTPPILLALDARVEVRSAGGARSVPMARFITGAGETVLRPGELVAAVTVPRARGPQRFLKLGNRSSVISAVVAVAVVVDVEQRRVRLAVGSAGQVPQRLDDVEDLASRAVDWDAGRVTADALPAIDAAVRAGCVAISDHRGSAAFRRHVAAVLTTRGLVSALSQGAAA